MLAERMERHGTHVWLVNTGWSGGAFGTGSRMPLKYTRAIIDGIHSGELRHAETELEPVFGLNMITQCAGVPDEVLIPSKSWKDNSTFVQTLNKLAKRFCDNFSQYADTVTPAVLEAGPKID